MKKLIKKFPANKFLLRVKSVAKSSFWFLTGFAIAGITIASLVAIFLQNFYKEKVIPGVYVNNVSVGEKRFSEVKKLFHDKNNVINNSSFTLIYGDDIATLSAKTLGIGYNSDLIATQAISVGKSSNLFSNLFNILEAYMYGITLDSTYTMDMDTLNANIKPMVDKAYEEAIDAQFQVENEKVVAFKESKNGKKIDPESAVNFIKENLDKLSSEDKSQNFTFEFEEIVLKPKVTTEEANEFGIVEPIGEGVSYFPHSIPNRIFNVNLASQRVNGILVKPGEEFSFVKYLGDVSKYTGYAEAYIIQNGRTVLGDGGGVCQVSTTLFRAILNSGLPITERRAHAYRVSYYEAQSPPGLDATVYYPTVDLKFKNDTGNYILIQSYIDLEEQSLRYVLYGKKDGREVEMTEPVVTNYVPAPEPLNQDDPTLPKGTVKQVDFAAAGATVVFSRKVTKDGKTLIDEKYTSRYAPWRAVYLVGTKEG